jgi:hypothetical protein
MLKWSIKIHVKKNSKKNSRAYFFYSNWSRIQFTYNSYSFSSHYIIVNCRSISIYRHLQNYHLEKEQKDTLCIALWGWKFCTSSSNGNSYGHVVLVFFLINFLGALFCRWKFGASLTCSTVGTFHTKGWTKIFSV